MIRQRMANLLAGPSGKHADNKLIDNTRVGGSISEVIVRTH